MFKSIYWQVRQNPAGGGGVELGVFGYCFSTFAVFVVLSNSAPRFTHLLTQWTSKKVLLAFGVEQFPCVGQSPCIRISLHPTVSTAGRHMTSHSDLCPNA